MNVPILLAVVLSFCALVMSCNRAGGKADIKHVNSVSLQQPSQQHLDVTKETAIKAAVTDAEKTYGGTDQFVIISCDQLAFWRIVFEPKIGGARNLGPEYVVDKRTGSIVGKRDLPVVPDINFQRSARSPNMSKETAIAVARKDAIRAYGALTDLDLTVCEFTNVWRVIYSPKIGLNGGGPEYVIDKSSGKIIERKYYQ